MKNLSLVAQRRHKVLHHNIIKEYAPSNSFSTSTVTLAAIFPIQLAGLCTQNTRLFSTLVLGFSSWFIWQKGNSGLVVNTISLGEGDSCRWRGFLVYGDAVQLNILHVFSSKVGKISFSVFCLCRSPAGVRLGQMSESLWTRIKRTTLNLRKKKFHCKVFKTWWQWSHKWFHVQWGVIFVDIF